MSDDELMASVFRHEWIVDSPVYAVLPQYLSHFRAQRYADGTTRLYLSSLAHFCHWIKASGFGVVDINETLAEEFVNCHLPSCRCPRPCRHQVATTRVALEHLLSVLREHGLGGMAHTQPPAPIIIELDQFRNYLVDVCGCAPATCKYRLFVVHRFLSRLFGNGPVTITRLVPQEIEDFVAQFAKDWQRTSVQVVRSSLVSYLRFRALHGTETQLLMAAIPLLAPRGNGSLPTRLTEADLTAFLRAFDLTDSIGLRDYAVARCLVDLGLRCREIVQMTLKSFNWQDGTVALTHNKSGRARRLPLPMQTGEAIVRYLREGRPETCNRAVFVRHVAPFDKPIGAGAIYNLINRAFVRAGLSDRYRGPHMLRRAAATRLVKGGATLKEIADVLGHRSLDTTTLYATADLARLRAVALPWPGASS